MKKIEKLTPEQEAMMPEWVDKWTKIGLCTDEADVPAATKAVHAAYKVAKLPPPNKIIVCDGPLSGAITASVLKRGDPVRSSVGSSVEDSVWSSVRSSVGSSVWSSVEDSVRSSVWSSVWSSVGSSVWSSVGSSVEDSVRSSVEDSVRSSVEDSVRSSVRSSVGSSVEDFVRSSVWSSVGSSVYGSHDAGWLSFYSFMRDVLKLECVGPLDGLIDLAHHCGWWIPYENIAIIQHRHNVLKLDDRGRLHSEAGHAVEYRDGWGLSCWHGTAIPDEWANGKPPTAQEAIQWGNIEQRRAACEIVGWHNILDSLDARVIDKNQNPQIGTLLEVDLPDSGKERFLRVKCGTGRDFCLPVPNDMDTALNANAWSYDVNPEIIDNLEIRT